jgi:hypothetical protein
VRVLTDPLGERRAVAPAGTTEECIAGSSRERIRTAQAQSLHVMHIPLVYMYKRHHLQRPVQIPMDEPCNPPLRTYNHMHASTHIHHTTPRRHRTDR